MRGAVVGGIVTCLLGTAVAQPVPPQPTTSGRPGPGAAKPAPDYAHAAELYKAAEAAAAADKLDDAIRDYAAAYEITKDPVLFYKIGLANQRANKCEVALVYFGRYLREGKPEKRFADLTERRITACGGDPDKLAAAPVAAGTVTQPAPPSTPPAKPLPPQHGTGTTWLVIGAGVGLVIAGGVLAYSAKSSERDVEDLYAGLDGKAPQFTPAIKARYDELVDQGHRYQYLSWASFGAAAVVGGIATWLFLRQPTESIQLAPAVTPTSAGVSASVSF